MPRFLQAEERRIGRNAPFYSGRGEEAREKCPDFPGLRRKIHVF